MKLRDYIEEGTKKAGSLTELGKLIGQEQRNMSNIKAEKRKLTPDGVVKLAVYLKCDVTPLMAANELVTEKDEKKREFWLPFTRQALYVAGFAIVTNFVTLPDCEAAPILASEVNNNLYYVKSRRKKQNSKERHLLRPLARFIKRLLETLEALLPVQVAQIQAI